MWLQHNQLSGEIPSELGQLGQLQTLSLYNNQLDSLPAALGQLGQLQTLSLENNQLSGSIPPELGQLGQLRALYLHRNQLSGPIPAALGQLGQLQTLWLQHNQLSGEIPVELMQLNELTTLSLRNNCLTSNRPALIAFIDAFDPGWQDSQSTDCAVPRVALTVTKTGSGTGTVTGPGINCGHICAATLIAGTEVTLTASPAGGSTFAGWSGVCSGTGSCQVTMHQSRSVTATFTLTPVYGILAVTKAGDGNGAVMSTPPGIDCGHTCTTSFVDGSSVTLAATPVLGSTFAGWSGACTGSGTCQIVMSQAREVAAAFNLTGSGGVRTFANGVRFESSAARTLALMYVPSFGRAPVASTAPAQNDAAGLLFWANQFLGGSGAITAYHGDVGGIGEFFIRSDEFAAQVAAQFGAGTTVETLTDAQFINLLYDNLLARSANAEELAFWTGRIAQFGRGSVLADIAFSDEFQSLMPPELVAAIDTFISVIGASDLHLTPGFNPDDPSIRTIAAAWLTAYPHLDPAEVSTAARAPRGAVPVASRIAATPPPPSESAVPLIWSELPEALRETLTTWNATLRDAQSSGDGQTIVFATEAPLDPRDDNEVSDIYHYDLAQDRLTLLSRSERGAAGNAPSHSPRFDVIGRQVIFLSQATNLVRGRPHTAQQVYTVAIDTGIVRRLSEPTWGEPADGDVTVLTLAGDAGTVVYHTAATNLEGGPGLYRHDLRRDLREIAVFEPWTHRADPQAQRPTVDAHARVLAYDRPDHTGHHQVYTRDLNTWELWHDRPLDAAARTTCCARFSTDGRYLAYQARDDADSLRLHVLDTTTGHHAATAWPLELESSAAALSPEFRNHGRELWWIAPEQGPGLPDVLHRILNPVFAAP